MTAPEGRVALVTGGGSGIGAATARRLAGRGMRVALMGRTRSRLERTAEDITAAGSPSPLVVEGHQEDEESVRAAVTQVRETFGAIDVLFNNAATYEPGTTCEAPLESWDRTLAINVRGPLLLARAVVPLMRERGGGVIVNNASTLGLRPIAGFAAYSVSKAALISLTRCLALEEAKHRIRVLAICPGVVDTPIHDRPDREAFLSDVASLHPLGRVGTADEVAALVDYLVADDASWMTGSVITIDGGISLT